MEKEVDYYKELIGNGNLSEEDISIILKKGSHRNKLDLISFNNIPKKFIDDILEKEYYDLHNSIIYNQVLDDEELLYLLSNHNHTSSYANIGEVHLVMKQDLTNIIKSQPGLIMGFVINSLDISLLAKGIILYQNAPEDFLKDLRKAARIENYKLKVNALSLDQFKSKEDSFIGYVHQFDPIKSYRKLNRLTNISTHNIFREPDYKKLNYSWLKVEFSKKRFNISVVRPVDKFSKICYVYNGKRGKLL